MGETAPTGNPSAVPKAGPYTPILPGTVNCPGCNSQVSYASFCSKCGARLPPVFLPPAIREIPHRRRSRALVLGIILAIVLGVSVAGVAGYFTYQDRQESIQQAAAHSELIATNQAIALLSITCFSNRTDTSTFVRTSPTSGYLTLYEKFGVYNPSQYSMDTTWTLTFDYTSIHVVLSSLRAFHLSTASTSYPEFPFLVTATQASTLASAIGTPQFTATLDGTYIVTGTYSTYHISQHQTIDSWTGTGTQGVSAGSAGAAIPSCP